MLEPRKTDVFTYRKLGKGWGSAWSIMAWSGSPPVSGYGNSVVICPVTVRLGLGTCGRSVGRGE